MSAASQSAFAAALVDPSLPAPEALAAANGASPAKRFAVYRNNVAVSLVGALASRFPAVRRIVGEAFFATLARAFAASEKPRSPLMAAYGDGFADFIVAAQGLEELPYLADVARLEAARTRAYHAEDVEPLGADAFATLDADALDHVTVRLHPSAEVVRSDHPVVTIWAMNAGEADLGPVDDLPREDALVCRPLLDVVVRALPPGGAAFLSALRGGAPLGEAAATASGEAEDFDLTQNLIGLIETGLAVSLAQAGPTGDAP